ncbi:MOSC domain-containing protein [Pusillimonas sp. TS35]|nr:MOSC domain-containing protein [Pusillimonas sp. TS35]
MVMDSSTFGRVTHLCSCPRAYLPMRYFDSLKLIEGVGIEGDRYASGMGYYSDRPEEGRQVTLFEIETLDALKRDHSVDLEPHEHRRNITVSGVALNHLVGRQFWIGDALLQATRLSTPCKHLEEVTGKQVFATLINRAGLNCKILRTGVIHVGDTVRPAGAFWNKNEP